MIPILHSKDSKDFTTNGIGRLTETTECYVEEELNGIYEIEFKYPVDGVLFEEIKAANIVVAKANEEGKENQAFVIYKVSKPLNGIITVKGEHVSYRLNGVIVPPFSSENIAGAIAKINDTGTPSNDFTVTTVMTEDGVFENQAPSPSRELMGDLVENYGMGEWEFDNFQAKLYNRRGQDNNVEIRYGKNLIDLTQEELISNVVTGIYPFYKTSDEYLELPEKIIDTAESEKYGFPKIAPVDLTVEFEEIPTVEQLREKAVEYIETGNIGVPEVSLKVEFVALSQTEEYKNKILSEKVSLGDTITVIFEKLVIDTKARINKVKYNVLEDRYETLSVGEPEKSLSSHIAELQKSTNILNGESWLDGAVKHATALITGNEGGYVLLKKGPNGKPYEIDIMDTEDIQTAMQVWRWNKSGLGYSDNGYDGPYETAITSDGQIVADFIKAGELQGIIIRGTQIIGAAIEGGSIKSENEDGTITFIEDGFIRIRGTLGNGMDLDRQRIRFYQEDGMEPATISVGGGGLLFSNQNQAAQITMYDNRINIYCEGGIYANGKRIDS